MIHVVADLVPALDSLHTLASHVVMRAAPDVNRMMILLAAVALVGALMRVVQVLGAALSALVATAAAIGSVVVIVIGLLGLVALSFGLDAVATFSG